MKRMKLLLTGLLGASAFFTACTKDPLKSFNGRDPYLCDKL